MSDSGVWNIQHGTHAPEVWTFVPAPNWAELEDCIPGVESEGSADLAFYTSGSVAERYMAQTRAAMSVGTMTRLGVAAALDPAPDRCWRCDAAQGETDVGLCPTCHADLTAS